MNEWTVPDRVASRAANNWRYIEGCRVSTYATNQKGYAQIAWRENYKHFTVGAHRAAWVFWHGPIPDDLTVDHLPTCNRACVNPDHLRLVTHQVNSSGGDLAPLSERVCGCGEQMVLYRDGRYYCRPCMARSKRLRRAARRATTTTHT